ncbi:MAG: (2Fe-2S)-binding protein [Pseudomonadota bacterium]|nr:MAG: (2Fe-2S)-binding protein [Pseudomonadota bacterium]
MLVCHCKRVCDRTIRQCVLEGARSVDQVGAACRAGTGCGGCRPLVEALIELEVRRRESGAGPTPSDDYVAHI